MTSNPLIVKSDIKTLKNIFSSKNFIAKIFDCDKNMIIDSSEGFLHMQKNYTVNDLEKMFTITDYIKENIIPKIKNIKIELNIYQKIIYHTDDLLVIKYICTIDKPVYVKTMLADQTTVFYIKIYPTQNNNELLLINYFRKFIPSGDDEINNDDDIINDVNVLNINTNYDSIQFNQGLIMAASALIGEETLNDIVIPFIYKIFDDFIDNILTKRIKIYFKKKDIDVYIKKKN